MTTAAHLVRRLEALPLRSSRSGTWARLASVVVVALLATGCGGSDGGGGAGPPAEREPNRGPIPTLPGGVDLTAVDPANVLVGDGLAYGRPLPSEQVAADAYLEDPEVRSVTARRILSRRDGRLIGHVRVLQLDGTQVFDESVLQAFVGGTIGALADADEDEVEVAGRPVHLARGQALTAIGYLQGDLLVAITAAVEQDARTVVGRQLAALAAGAPGSLEPMTPLLPASVDAAFVVVPTVTFELIPPPEEEVPPEPGGLIGATAVEGRYGVVAGERRVTVWVYTLDLVGFPTAESHDAALAALVSERVGGATAAEVEVVDRLVVAGDGADGERSARAFRHHGLVLLLEGLDPVQLDATVSDWITALVAP